MDRVFYEIAKYLGCISAGDIAEIYPVISHFYQEVKEIASPRYSYKIMSVKSYNPIKLVEYEIDLPGKDINSHLCSSKKVAFIAATLGLEIDRRIATLQYNNLSDAVVMDACASAYIEVVVDKVDNMIQEIVDKENLERTSRFSPGYGDFPLSFQKDIDKVLNLYKSLGVTLNKNNILLPRKSVTAIIGIGSNNNYTNCMYCNINCPSRKQKYRERI